MKESNLPEEFSRGWPKLEQLKGLKGILLDLDNTFYEYEPCHLSGLRSSYELIASLTDWSWEEFQSKYEEAQKVVKSRIGTQAASHSRLLYFQALSEIAFGSTKVTLSLNLERSYWDSFLTAMEIKPEAIGLLDSCHSLGIKTCLVTDLTAQIQFQKLKISGLEHKIDLVVTSEEAGADKPDPAIFRLALEKLGMDPAETIMVGDSAKKDGSGARELGIRFFLV